MRRILKMSSDEDEFLRKFVGYTIPKKKSTEDVTDTVVEKAPQPVPAPVQTPAAKKEYAKTPQKTKKVTRKSANDFLEDDDSLPIVPGGADPLGLEPVITYGEAKGTRHTAFEVFLAQYESELPKVIIDQCSDLKCDVCCVDFMGSLMVAKSHYAGKNHGKKFKQALEEWHKEDPQNNIIPQLKQVEVSSSSCSVGEKSFFENRHDHDETYCHVCNIELSSKIVATSHYQGKNHAKQLRKRQSDGFVPTESFPAKRPKITQNQNILSDIDSRQGSGNRFFCLGCKLHFKSNPEFINHLQSDEHREKSGDGVGAASNDAILELQATQIDLPNPQNDIAFDTVPTNDSIDDMLSKLRANPKSAFDCSLCQVQCSSQATLSTHLAGKQHKKKLELSQRMATGSQFRCDICNIETTDQNGLDMHLSGKKHMKKANGLKA